MEQRTNIMFFLLLRSALCGTKLTEQECNNYSPELLSELIKLSTKHDLVHLIVFGLKQNQLIGEENAVLDNHLFQAVCRYERLQHEYENLCQIFEEAKISFLPLKGSVIRQYYLQTWMRTSCDVDILVRETDLERAKQILLNEHGYTYHKKNAHDVSFFTPTNIHVELHYDLVEDGLAKDASKVLKDVWETAVCRNGYNFWYEMPDEVYYFYHIAHMAKHFENGGCGIRPFIDLWILDNLSKAENKKREELLKKGGLLKFAKAARKLSRIWLENEEYDALSKQMEDYILRGGVYGNTENRVVVQQQKQGGRIRYAFSRICIPYETIKFYYPVLQKYRWLTPFMQIRRWCKLIFGGYLKRSANELKLNMKVSNARALAVQELLNNIGLR